MDAQVSLDASTETAEKLRQFIESVQESNLSIQKQVQREREVFKAKVVANAKQTSKLYRLLSDLIKGDSSDVQALQSKAAVQRDRIHRMTRANGIRRQQVDLRAMDADTLVLATEGSFPPLPCILPCSERSLTFCDVSFLTGITSGDINLGLLDLDQSTRDALAQLQQLDAAAGVSTPLEMNVAKAVHHTKNLAKRHRLRRAGSSSESSPSPSSDSDDSKRPHCKPSGSPKAALGAGLVDVPGIASDPSPSKRRGSRMLKAWRKTKPAKKRRAASGPIEVPPKDRPAFKTTDPRLRDSPAAPAAPSSRSPPPIVPSVGAPASGPSLVVTQGSSQAPLSTGDSPVRESASDSGVLGLESEVVEVSSGDEGLRSPAAPSSGDVEEKTDDVTVDSPVQEVPSSQPSGRVLSVTLGLGPVIRPSSDASVESSAASDTQRHFSCSPRPGVVIVSAFAPRFDPRSTIPSSDTPVPVHGVKPIVRSSAKLLSSTNPIVDLRFHKRSAQRCWFAIICARVPTPIGARPSLHASSRASSPSLTR
ncbi:hypothetical protein GQ600_11775 [Phytophthora cactorum]|nr:hypothetical protein GQ600_11775 [Phytophthora cactorum]